VSWQLQRSLSLETIRQSPVGCRAAAMLVSGGCAALGGQTLDAKQRLARALKLALGLLGNHQLGNCS